MPCKPRMRGCAAACLHRQLVENYRDARDAWESTLEDTAKGYAAEEREFSAAHPGPTFKQWLIDSARVGPTNDPLA